MNHWLKRASELQAKGDPFAMATVVAATAPTSAKPGAKAIITADGTLEGWIGGGCAQSVVIEEALAALQSGGARLIRLSPDVELDTKSNQAVKELAMRCESGGTLEIHIEPVLPGMKLLIFGDGPVAHALAGLAAVLDYDIALYAPGGQGGELPSNVAYYNHFDAKPAQAGEVSAAVVATQGHGDEQALAAAIKAQVGYLTMITSRKKSESLFAGLEKRGIPAAALGKVKVPAGLDIKAVTPGEIAVSVLAEIIQVTRAGGLAPNSGNGAAKATPAATEIDPVCGMTVDRATAAGSSKYEGTTFYFCSLGCLESFESNPEKYAP
ncbi:MAG: XdhC family protein [Candidatus Marinimicrobia bacterium]|nr:XdhC family protein [Candidatus Neomarinimicrobiota bacterium]